MCQYHGWTFSKENGSCLAATRMDEGFDMSPWSLETAWVEEFYGLVFINFSEDRPVSVADSTAHLFADRDPFGGYDLTRMKPAATRTLEFPANWKVVRENDDECYHCALNHPELAERYYPWAGFTVVDDLTEDRDMWTGHNWAFLELGFQQSAPVCKVPTPRVRGDDGFDHQDVQFFWAPSGHIIVQRDHAWIWSIRPFGPESTLMTQHWLVADSAEAGKDYDEEQLVHLLLLGHEWANPAATKRSYELIAQHVFPHFQGQAEPTLAAKERATRTREEHTASQLAAVDLMTERYEKELAEKE